VSDDAAAAAAALLAKHISKADTSAYNSTAASTCIAAAAA
jgi:hypothetical protein